MCEEERVLSLQENVLIEKEHGTANKKSVTRKLETMY